MAELKNLDALADQLYQEGMGKAQKEAEKLLNETKKESEDLLRNAQKEANEIIAKAKKEAEKHRSVVENEIHQKAKVAKQDLKNQIEQLITAKILDSPSKDVLTEKEFVSELILSSMEKWKDGYDLNLSIPYKIKNLRADLETKIHAHLPDIKITANEHLDSGFKIVNKDQGYFISFTDEDFKALFQPYLSKAVSKLLFDSDSGK